MIKLDRSRFDDRPIGELGVVRGEMPKFLIMAGLALLIGQLFQVVIFAVVFAMAGRASDIRVSLG